MMIVSLLVVKRPFRNRGAAVMIVSEEAVAAYLALLRSNNIATFLARDTCCTGADK